MSMTTPRMGTRTTSHKKPLSRRAIDNIVSRRDVRYITECGCVVAENNPIFEGLGRIRLTCKEHGSQLAVRKATRTENINSDLQLPLDSKPEYPDIPPF
jgi:hypothetical protein